MTNRILNSVLVHTGSQCSDLNSGVLCLTVLVLVRTLAAAFWTSCSCLTDFYTQTCEDTVTIVLPAENKIMNKFLCILFRQKSFKGMVKNKNKNSVNVCSPSTNLLTADLEFILLTLLEFHRKNRVQNLPNNGSEW